MPSVGIWIKLDGICKKTDQTNNSSFKKEVYIVLYIKKLSIWISSKI